METSDASREPSAEELERLERNARLLLELRPSDAARDMVAFIAAYRSKVEECERLLPCGHPAACIVLGTGVIEDGPANWDRCGWCESVSALRQRAEAAEAERDKWQVIAGEFERGRDHARELATRLQDERTGSVHLWEGDGTDDPESLACPVLMHPEDLRKLLAKHAALRDEVIANDPRLHSVRAFGWHLEAAARLRAERDGEGA